MRSRGIHHPFMLLLRSSVHSVLGYTQLTSLWRCPELCAMADKHIWQHKYNNDISGADINNDHQAFWLNWFYQITLRFRITGALRQSSSDAESVFFAIMVWEYPTYSFSESETKHWGPPMDKCINDPGHHWFWWRPFAYSSSRDYPNQCWLIVN